MKWKLLAARALFAVSITSALAVCAKLALGLHRGEVPAFGWIAAAFGMAALLVGSLFALFLTEEV